MFFQVDHYAVRPIFLFVNNIIIHRIHALFFFFSTGLLSDLWDLKAAHTTSPLILLQDVQFEKVFEFTLHICECVLFEYKHVLVY